MFDGNYLHAVLIYPQILFHTTKHEQKTLLNTFNLLGSLFNTMGGVFLIDKIDWQLDSYMLDCEVRNVTRRTQENYEQSLRLFVHYLKNDRKGKLDSNNGRWCSLKLIFQRN